MKIPFDKVYCISYCRNIEKQKNVRRIMNYLGIDFEFIYGADYSNLKILENLKFYGGPNITDKEYLKLNWKHYVHFIGASYDHYTAIINAYESGANSVLIMEDDCAFINDIEHIEYYLNNYPEDADFVKFGLCYFKPIYNQVQSNVFKENNYYLVNNSWYAGSQLYGVCNRETMKKYIDKQRVNFVCCDMMYNITDKCYGLVYPLAIDNKFICDDESIREFTKNKYSLV